MFNQEELRELLLNANDQELQTALRHVYPSDILDIINGGLLETDIEFILNRLSADLLAQLLDEEQQEDKYDLLQRVSKNKHRDVLDEMSSDEIVDMIETIDDETEANEVLDKLSIENKQEVQQLMTYAPDTAGGIMATEFINLYDNKTVESIFEYLQEIKDEVDSPYALYVTDKQNHLKGVLTLSDIATSSFDTPVTEIANPNVVYAHYDDDQEEVAQLFDKYNLLVIPVVNDDHQILGIVTFDDILEVMKQEATEDIHQMGGIDALENVDSTVKETVQSRLPWLITNLIALILVSTIINYFSQTISQVVILASLIPIVAGMGGNVGSQTLTFTVRSLAINEIDQLNAKEVFKREIQAAIINGLIISIGMFLVSWLLGNSFYLGLIVGVAMLITVLISAGVGYIVPIILQKLNIDPALGSNVFVTTITDAFAFVSFLGLATMFIEYLL